MKNNMSNTHYHAIRDKWIARHDEAKNLLLENHARAYEKAKKGLTPQKILAGSLGSLALLNASSAAAIPFTQNTVVLASSANLPQFETISDTINTKPDFSEQTLIKDLTPSLPSTVYDGLNDSQNTKLIQTLSQYFNVQVKSEINGISLNTNYGIIGQEQHLALYPGDSIQTHFQTLSDNESFNSYGIAPGRGAWGYFASSKEALTQQDIDREKYYIAVQTFLSPGYIQNSQKYYDFFKYRKVLVVNPSNGKAIVADIGDAGPSPFTGKQLGGSPEVMRYLQRVDGRQRGPVLFYFIDDTDNTIPLGPINIVK